MPAPVTVTHFSDPGCPWAYSASPAHALLRWRFGDQLDWRLVLIGLAEDAQRYVDRGHTPVKAAQGYRRFRRFGMPFAGQPRARMSATGLACRAVVAARVTADGRPGAELAVFRALQLTQFTTTELFDTPEGIRAGLGRLNGDVDADAVLAALGDERVEAAYQADRALARTAEGTPTEAQGREANSDGAVRYTAPSLIFTHADGRRLEVGGFQPWQAYDTALANLDTRLERRAPADDPLDVLRVLPYAPTTREVSICQAGNLDEVDDDATEAALIAAAGDGRVRREAVGSGALWHLAA